MNNTRLMKKYQRTQFDIDNNISQDGVDFWEGMMDECEHEDHTVYLEESQVPKLNETTNDPS